MYYIHTLNYLKARLGQRKEEIWSILKKNSSIHFLEIHNNINYVRKYEV